MSSDAEEADAEESIDLEALNPADYRTRTGSLSSSALPHKHVPDGLEWEINSCVTDTGEEPPREPSTNTISLVDRDWDSVTITATVDLPDWCYDLVFPTGSETGAGELVGRMGLVYWCRSTILRDSSDTQLVDSPGSYEFELTIPKDRTRQTLKIEPALVSVDVPEGASEYASESGHRLAEGEAWTLKTDLRESTRNLLQPETKSFSDDPDLPGEDHLLFVDFDRNPPGLYLNGDHERVIAALDTDAYQGWDASVRDVAYDTIEAELWPQMILEAASDITEDEGPEEPWKQGVIEKFKEAIYGEDTSYEEAVDLLREDVNTPNRLPRLMQDIDDAIQTRNDAPSHLSNLLNLVDNR